MLEKDHLSASSELLQQYMLQGTSEVHTWSKWITRSLINFQELSIIEGYSTFCNLRILSKEI